MAAKAYRAYDHASHNLKAHQYIKESTHFPDWEITTAFYCALKFFEGSLFPEVYLHPGKEGDGEKKEFFTYNEYKKLFGRFCQGTPHDIMKRFVQYNTPEIIWRSYSDLYDVSHNSRYKNYQIDKEDLEIARESLKVIMDYCNENLK